MGGVIKLASVLPGADHTDATPDACHSGPDADAAVMRLPWFGESPICLVSAVRYTPVTVETNCFVQSCDVQSPMPRTVLAAVEELLSARDPSLGPLRKRQ